MHPKVISDILKEILEVILEALPKAILEETLEATIEEILENREAIFDNIAEALDNISEAISEYTRPLKLKAVKQFMTEQVEALPNEQKQALSNYTGFDATQINTAIRHHRITPEIQRKIDLLDKALKNGVMPATVTLHRDTSFSFIATQLELPAKPTEEELSKSINRIVVNPIFTSTSFENLGLVGRNTQLWLTIPAGYRGCQFIQPVARPKFKNQVEVLFARGMRFKITKAKIENGKYILWAEVLL